MVSDPASFAKDSLFRDAYSRCGMKAQPNCTMHVNFLAHLTVYKKTNAKCCGADDHFVVNVIFDGFHSLNFMDSEDETTK